MKVKVINASSRKTREKIKKAFAELVKEKEGLNKVSVTDLVNKADITRSAFYTHYDNIYEVAKEIQNETLDVLIKNIDQFKEVGDIDAYFDEIFHYLEDNEDIYSMILSSQDPLLFTFGLNKIIVNTLSKALKDRHHHDFELNLYFFIDGSMSLVIKHYRKEINYSLDEIKAYMKETFKTLFLNSK